jgi:hypothetical protein
MISMFQWYNGVNIGKFLARLGVLLHAILQLLFIFVPQLKTHLP